MPRRGMSVLTEAVLVVVVGLAIGLTANATSGRGLRLTKDYFHVPAAAHSAATATPSPAITESPSSTAIPPKDEAAEQPHEVGELLAGGLCRVVDHDAVVAIYQSDGYHVGSCIIVDARDDGLYTEGHIPGAYQLDHYYPETYLESLLPVCARADMIVVYCTGVECEDSELAAGDLLDAGVPADKLRVYRGGIEEWEADGLPLERGERLSDDLFYPDQEGQE